MKRTEVKLKQLSTTNTGALRDFGKYGHLKPALTLSRVVAKPDPGAWGADELLTLQEAVALFWPQGPLRVKTLRNAIASGLLPHARVAGRLYVTRNALAEMATCRPRAAVTERSGTR